MSGLSIGRGHLAVLTGRQKPEIQTTRLSNGYLIAAAMTVTVAPGAQANEGTQVGFSHKV